MHRSYVLFLALALTGCAQAPKNVPAAGSSTTTVVPKSTLTSDELDRAAREAAISQTSFDAQLKAAQQSLAEGSKDLQKQAMDLSKELDTKLHADKKYKPLLDQIDAVQKQLKDAGTAAGQKFSASVGPLQSQIAGDNSIVKALVPVVRKENHWPDSATYDPATQTWHLAAGK